jgi:glycosyltransferase involved in cell wall biosynthesis
MVRTVAFVVSTLARCGPVNVLKGIAENLDPERYRPIIVTLSREGHNSCIDDFRASGACVKQLKMSRGGSLLIGRDKLQMSIESSRADIVHSHGFRADVLVASAGLQCPTVSTIHADLSSEFQLLGYGRCVGRLMARLQYAALTKFAAVAAVSESAAKRATEFALRTEVIANGIDLNTYAALSTREEIKEVRGRLGWPEDRFVILHTGVLHSRKRPLEVVAAFQRSDASKCALLVFAGDGPLLEQCVRAAKNSPNIIFLGSRSNLPEMLRAADFLVSNSTSEGLPMALLEACACGLKVLASDIQPHRYIASLFPEQMTLFPLEDSGALMKQMNALPQPGPSNPIRPPGDSLENISAERMSRLYQDLYDRAVLSHSQN